MRSCIYCGKELEDGEQCNCSAALARRAAKNKETDSYESGNSGGYYQTGYANTSRADAKRTRKQTKAAERRNRPKRRERDDFGSVFAEIWTFIKSPVETILNPKNFSMPQMIIMALIQGALLGLGGFFAVTGVSRSWFRAAANLIGFGGTQGYVTVFSIAASAVSGAVAGIIFFFVYVGVFYLINRLIFRLNNTFHEMAQKLALTTIPWCAVTLVGVMASFISASTLMTLMLCGWFISLILTYLALNNEWSNYSNTRSLYFTAIGYFIIFSMIFALIRAALM